MMSFIILFAIATLGVITLDVEAEAFNESSLNVDSRAAKIKCNFGAVPNTDGCDICGESFRSHNADQRIVGGVEAQIGSWPAQALVVVKPSGPFYFNGAYYMLSSTFLCGATIVNKFTILTAAHCIPEYIVHKFNGIEYAFKIKNPLTASFYEVYLGAHDIRFLNSNSNPVSPTIRMRVKKVIKHSKYNSMNFQNDIALILLSEPIEYNQNVQPACLPDSSALSNFPAIDSTVYASGWGALREGSSATNLLQNVRLTNYDTSKCQSLLGFAKNWNSQLCAGDMNGVKDTCQGDSGGGLYAYDANVLKKYIVVGITSYGEGCARYGTPGVYTRTSFYVDWIKSNWATSKSSRSQFGLFAFVVSFLVFVLNYHVY